MDLFLYPSVNRICRNRQVALSSSRKEGEEETSRSPFFLVPLSFFRGRARGRKGRGGYFPTSVRKKIRGGNKWNTKWGSVKILRQIYICMRSYRVPEIYLNNYLSSKWVSLSRTSPCLHENVAPPESPLEGGAETAAAATERKEQNGEREWRTVLPHLAKSRKSCEFQTPLCEFYFEIYVVIANFQSHDCEFLENFM